MTPSIVPGTLRKIAANGGLVETAGIEPARHSRQIEPRNGRGQRVADVRRLRAEGLTFREIGERLGIATTTAHEYFSDPTGGRAAERKARNNGICVDCGGETRNSGEKVAPLRCRACRRVVEKSMDARRVVAARQHGNRWSDGQVFAAIRSIAVAGVASQSDYLAAYETAPKGCMPSLATIIHRFGLWASAVAAAGLRTARRTSGPYTGSLSREGALLAVETCADTLGRPPTYREYQRWAREVGAPSGALVRVRCGGWMRAVEDMLTTRREAA